MRKFIIWVFIHFLLIHVLGCNPVKEIKEARDAAEKANRETKTLMENVREYAEHYFPLH
jgi:hypothetical protein